MNLHQRRAASQHLSLAVAATHTMATTAIIMRNLPSHAVAMQLPQSHHKRVLAVSVAVAAR
ncbi:hypothetical protein [Allorhodopirellula heiligendammensis]|uniref:hypothetical protein n=1 Tax=Allorhodopirellula heiligendammensis TaxID=2714739 RepID=UPI0011B62CE2|nr:hypothetical protein [Allorhodopirellula heiligendammensis]